MRVVALIVCALFCAACTIVFNTNEQVTPTVAPTATFAPTPLPTLDIDVLDVAAYRQAVAAFGQDSTTLTARIVDSASDVKTIVMLPSLVGEFRGTLNRFNHVRPAQGTAITAYMQQLAAISSYDLALHSLELFVAGGQGSNYTDFERLAEQGAQQIIQLQEMIAP